MRRILLVALAACSGGAKTTINNAGGGAPKGPAPAIAWAAGEPGSFTITGLPAIANDGSRVAIAYQAEDGARGFPNLTLLVKDRNDAEVDHKDVLELSGDENDPAEPTADAIDAANKYLASTHQQLGWNALPETDAVIADGAESIRDSEKQTMTSGTIVVTFEQKGHISVSDGGKVVLDRDEPSWLAPSSGECTNPALVDKAWIDAAHQLVLVDVGYTGSDECWEPDSELHVVAW